MINKMQQTCPIYPILNYNVFVQLKYQSRNQVVTEIELDADHLMVSARTHTPDH